ncbi:6-phosphogluconolactonase 3, chloroplastic-like [Neltuma alba]|uniref:6-phosphogluconolactonase 3, chloroplastic-like n=1 Tax=Neltuma alba TaxID=207710 RepID=UPI0010A584A1|nr:6-phosphogluconolactonase 3, chloroplastic-like [Prosopis alba]
MALSAVFLTSSPSCVPVNRPFCIQRSHSASQTTSSLMLPSQGSRKSQHQPLKSKRRLCGTVKALLQNEDKNYTKNVEVLSHEHLLDSLANDIVELSNNYIREKGSFSVALADTSSVRFLRRLLKPAYVNTIDWSKWQFFWVEEEVFVPGYQLKRAISAQRDTPQARLRRVSHYGSTNGWGFKRGYHRLRPNSYARSSRPL